MSQAAALVDHLRRRGQTIAIAESCTGGLVAAALTEIPGASAVFGYGLVTYSNEAKQRLLGVEEAVLRQHGAVSEATAQAMARGLLQRYGADLALAVTGIAGPEGGTAEKPVGLVYIAVGARSGIRVERCRFDGGRQAVRRRTVERALALAAALLEP